jgi:hypothetical protein
VINTLASQVARGVKGKSQGVKKSAGVRKEILLNIGPKSFDLRHIHLSLQTLFFNGISFTPHTKVGYLKENN